MSEPKIFVTCSICFEPIRVGEIYYSLELSKCKIISIEEGTEALGVNELFVWHNKCHKDIVQRFVGLNLMGEEYVEVENE